MPISLESYITGAAAFARQTLENEIDLTTPLSDLHETFDLLMDQLAIDDPGMPTVFVGMAHAAFLSAVTLAASGQVPSAAMVIRGCIEDAFYALYTYEDPELFDIWAARHSDNDSAQRVQQTFKIGTMKRKLRAQDAKLADRADFVYTYAIEQGAHPNVRALLSHLSRENPDSIAWQLVVSQPEGLRTILLVLVMTGITTLEIFRLCYPASFDHADLNGRIASLHEIIISLIAAWP